MSPVGSISLAFQTSWNASLSFPKTLSYSLRARSVTSPSPLSPPKLGFFGTLFRALSVLAALSSTLNIISQVWGWIHARHERNTAIAQAEVDKEFQAYHDEEWAYKEQRANARMMILLAKEKPLLFYRGYVRGRPMGSEERNRMVGILKMLNPEYYERNQNALGEAMEWDEVKSILKNA